MAADADPGSGAGSGEDVQPEVNLPRAPTTAYVPAPDGDGDGPADVPSTAPPEPVASPAAPAVVSTPTPEAPVEEDDPDRTGSTRRFAGLTLSFLVVLVALVYGGVTASLRMTGGAGIRPTALDPEDPGYEAVVKPTPTTLVTISSDDGGLRSMAIIAQGSGAEGGTVIVVPLSLLVGAPGGNTRLASYVVAESGLDELQSELAASIGFGMTKRLSLTESDVDALLGDRTVTVRNPETLMVDYDGTSVPQFESGELDLDAELLVAYLAYLGPEESEFNRLNRDQLVWESLLSMAGSGLGGEAHGDAATLGELIDTVGSGGGTVNQLPVEEGRISTPDRPGLGSSFTTPDRAAIRSLLPDIIPFPTAGVPGSRIGVKLLNGTDRPQFELQFAGDLIEVGAEVKVIGNAEDPVSASTVQVARDATDTEREQAQAVADLFGVELGEAALAGIDIRCVVTVGTDRM